MLPAAIVAASLSPEEAISYEWPTIQDQHAGQTLQWMALLT
jgi:hypothetical protein